MSPNEGFYSVKLSTELNLSESFTESKQNISNIQQGAISSSTHAPQDPQLLQHDYDVVLDMIGVGCAQWIVLLVSGLLLMLVINETMGMSIITIASQCDFGTTAIDKAIMNGASFVGIALFSYVWGYLSDTAGRRTVLLYSTIGGGFCSALSMFLTNFWGYVFMRFVVGVFIAGPSCTTYAFLGEFFTARRSALFHNYASSFVGIGMVYVPAVAWLVLSMDWSLLITDNFVFRPWRLLSFFHLLPGLLAVVILLKLPESPKLLLSLAKDDAALSAVNWICKRNTGKDMKQFGVNNLKAEPTSEADRVLLTSKSCFETVKRVWLETRPLLRRPHVIHFSMNCTIMAGMFFSSTGMGLWFSEIVNRISLSTDTNRLTICELIHLSILDDQAAANSTKVCSGHISQKSYIDSISLGICFVVGYALISVAIKIFGRKVSIIGSLLLSAVCCIALLILADPTAIVICFIIFVTMPGLCISLLSSGVVDLVPTHLRGKAVCIVFMIGRTGSVFGSNVIGALLASYCNLTFGFFAGCVFVCMILTLLLPI